MIWTFLLMFHFNFLIGRVMKEDYREVKDRFRRIFDPLLEGQFKVEKLKKIREEGRLTRPVEKDGRRAKETHK